MTSKTGAYASRPLAGHDILDTPPEEAFDGVARLAAALLDAPMAAVSLLDGDRQWFKARVGLDAAETPIAQSFCARAVEGDALFVVTDATADLRFADNPLVTGAPHIRFYAGAPIINRNGLALGSVCVIDTAPRRFGMVDRMVLAQLTVTALVTIEKRQC